MADVTAEGEQWGWHRFAGSDLLLAAPTSIALTESRTEMARVIVLDDRARWNPGDATRHPGALEHQKLDPGLRRDDDWEVCAGMTIWKACGMTIRETITAWAWRPRRSTLAAEFQTTRLARAQS
jgi:hypothetical protein